MERPATLGDLLLALTEMGFTEGQAHAAIQAGSLSLQEATEWLLQERGQRLQTAPPEEPGGAIAAFNLPKLQEVPLGSEAPRAEPRLPGACPPAPLGPSSWQATEGAAPSLSLSAPRGPSSPGWPGAEAGHSCKMKASRKELEEQQRERLAQEAKAEKQNKQKERELVLRRIADDRRRFQAKTQWAQMPAPPAAQGHRPEGRAQLASDGQCLLMIRLPSGQCLRERFPADCPLQHVTQRLSTLHPDLLPFTLLQGFPKRRFGPAELPCSLQALGLTPSATLCVLATKPLPSGTCALAAPQARDGPLQPPGPQALPVEEHAWGRGEILSLMPEEAMAEGMFPDAEELRLALSSPARRVVPGKPGVHGLWESTSPSHHHWGQGQRLTLGNPEQAPTVCSPLDEELSPRGSGPAPLLPSPSRGPMEPQHQWPAEGNRLRAADDGRGVGPSDLPGAVAQAAEQRFHNALRGQEEPAPPPGHKNPPRLSHVPSLFQMALRAAMALLTAPRKQYCSSLASLTPPLAERILACMIHHRLLRPKTLELFFGCQIQTLVLNCYAYATNELLRQLRAFQSLRHLSLVSCALLTDQGLSVVRHLQRLQHLNLSACVKLTDACLHFIKGLPHLSHLALDQTKISDCGMVDFLHSGPSALSHLLLNRTAITESTLRLLPQYAPHLALLSLQQTEISDFSALQQLSRLHTLHLDDTRVSQASLAALASHPALSTLTLSGVQSVDGDLALQLVSGLPLAQLSLPSRHTVTDSGLQFLCRLEGLLELDLTDFTHITDEGLRHLPQLHRLRRLSLCNTLVSDSGLQHLQGLQHLEELCLDRTAVSSAGAGPGEHARGRQRGEAGYQPLQTAPQGEPEPHACHRPRAALPPPSAHRSGEPGWLRGDGSRCGQPPGCLPQHCQHPSQPPAGVVPRAAVGRGAPQLALAAPPHRSPQGRPACSAGLSIPAWRGGVGRWRQAPPTAPRARNVLPQAEGASLGVLNKAGSSG
ncbi:uncharacterized protein LOC127045815 isoform X3 [Gopherus flavomarginatus]|uniref:uncharacterized protein LOC127045815 isoform X3 n=1 Tax=Gopherus flavomarginatus TaxID=286002 RepID=UPI0021CC1B56|nr:uncharacterized protein LOC127045815 isoform X3 [Gopherus flavomarginatus]